MKYQIFFNGGFFLFFKQIFLLNHYFFMIMENKSNENLIKSKIKTSVPIPLKTISDDWA